MVVQNRTVLNSAKLDELKKKKRKVLKAKIIMFFAGLVVVLTGLVFLLRWGELNIQSIEISGNKVIETKDIESIIRGQISGKYLWVIPKTSFVFYPRVGIEEELAAKIKRLKDISVNVKDTKTLVVTLAEREIKYTWCGNDLPKEELGPEKGVCYFTDEEGYIFDTAPYFSGDVYFRFYGKLNEPLGSYFYKDYFKKLVYWKEALESMNLKPVALRLNADDEVEIFLSKGGLPGPRIIIKAPSDEVKTMENLESALDTNFKTALAEKYDKLLYIDLRFDNKVYYRFDE